MVGTTRSGALAGGGAGPGPRAVALLGNQWESRPQDAPRTPRPSLRPGAARHQGHGERAAVQLPEVCLNGWLGQR